VGFVVAITHTRQNRRVFSYLTTNDWWSVDKGNARVFESVETAYNEANQIPIGKGQRLQIVQACDCCE
jgi:hypothetical protein